MSLEIFKAMAANDRMSIVELSWGAKTRFTQVSFVFCFSRTGHQFVKIVLYKQGFCFRQLDKTLKYKYIRNCLFALEIPVCDILVSR